MDDFITYDNVTFSYESEETQEAEATTATKLAEKSPAVNDVSFSVRQGEFVCIIGRNGSGKSTVARLMNALLLPSSGTIEVFGIDTKNEERVYDIRKSAGMVFQNPDNQIIGTTVEEDVAFGPENLGIPHDEMVVRVKEAIDGCGLTEFMKKEPHLLSGGQMQRVAIAGILAMKPRCIVFDESTAMLDPKGRRDVLAIARKLNREENITIVLITHHMDEIVDSDRVILIDKGRLIKKGTPRELFSDSALIEASGLELPQTAKLFDMLKNDGINVPAPVLTIGEGIDALCAHMKEN